MGNDIQIVFSGWCELWGSTGGLWDDIRCMYDVNTPKLVSAPYRFQSVSQYVFDLGDEENDDISNFRYFSGKVLGSSFPTVVKASPNSNSP